jgi:hypothetical protein
MPLILAIFASGLVADALELVVRGAQEVDPDRAVVAHRELDPGDRADLGAHLVLEVLHRHARHLVAVGESHVHARDVAALAGADVGGDEVDEGVGAHDRLDLARLGVGVLEARAHRHGEAEGGPTLVRLGYELGPHQREHEEARDEDRERDGEHLLAVAERPFEELAVAVVRPLDAALDLRHDTAQPRHARETTLGGIAPDRRKHRVEREAHEERHQHRDGHRDAELVEEPADDSRHERYRHEHRDDRERGRHDREPDLVGSLARRAVVVLAHAQVAHDVLAHHDGVVDEQPDAQDSAMRVRKFSVNPNRYTAMKVAITEIGSVRPVMIVLRHECRNMKTMKTVSSAPSMIVTLVPFSDFSMKSTSA